MDSVYLVFRVYPDSSGNGAGDCVFLVACSSKQSAIQYCKDNGLVSDENEIYTSTSAALFAIGKKHVVIEKVAVI